jgi:hypothetical protein
MMPKGNRDLVGDEPVAAVGEGRCEIDATSPLLWRVVGIEPSDLGACSGHVVPNEDWRMLARCCEGKKDTPG